jgi:hypothetical protein
VVAEHLGFDPVQLEELQRLRVIAGGHRDLVSALSHELDQRPKHKDMRGRRHVDPDPHRSSSLRRLVDTERKETW